MVYYERASHSHRGAGVWKTFPILTESRVLRTLYEPNPKGPPPLHYGFLCLALGALFWYGLVPDAPWNDYALTMGGSVARGVIVDAWEEQEDTDRGWVTRSSVVYRFETDDGRTVEGDRSWEGDLLVQPGERVEIEYLRRSPQVNRPAAETSGWALLRRSLASLLLLGLCLAPGVSCSPADSYERSHIRGPRASSRRLLGPLRPRP